MNARIDKILEMALDFATHEINDPHEPEFHKTLAGEAVVAYYGTTSAHFWEILRQGIDAKPTIKRGKGESNDLSLDIGDARDIARRRTYAENNEKFEGAVKAMVLIVETKIQKPYQAGNDEVEQFLAGTNIGAEANTLLPLHIKPNAITGVHYEGLNWENAWEIPIKKFIGMAQNGEIEGLGEDETFQTSKYRPYKPTIASWQTLVLSHVNNLLNYSSNLFDYLVGAEHPVPFTDTIIREATKVGLPTMMNWTAREFMEWLYKILPNPHGGEYERPVEEDIEQVLQNADMSGVRPGDLGKLRLASIWRLLQKDAQDTLDYRTGKKTNERPRQSEY